MATQGQDPQYGRGWLGRFGLDPALIHANHGSFGAVPDVVRQSQRTIQDQLSANPTGFLRDTYPGAIRDAARAVAGVLGGAAEQWVFVDNATSGMNIILSQCALAAGDEVLCTDQVYGAVRKTIARLCAQHGARAVEVPLPLPVHSEDALFDLITAAVTPRTRLVVLDHISSPCAITFPIQRLCAHFRALGITTVVDGAHGPGNLDLDVPAIGADYYTANLHKWLSAPLGAAVLWTRETQLQPLIVSHGIYDGYTEAFDWPGTRDPSAWLAVPAAIAFHGAQGGAELRARNHRVAQAAGQQLVEDFDSVFAAPEGMHSSMVAIRLLADRALAPEACRAVQQRAQATQRAVVQITPGGGATWLRLSSAIYSTQADLVEAGRRVFDMLRVEGV